MLSSAKIGTASWRYYTAGVACAATEYYLGIGEAPGRWHGRGLPELGLEPGAVVSEAQLEALFARALHPVSGARLGRAWRADGITGFDLTFSAPKSVSSLWALADPDTAAQVRGAHAAAVTAALSYLDTHASWSRRGVNGTQQIATEGLVAACFEHRTSRCADPQVHTHALVVNKVACADGMWRTLDATELYHHKKSAGMIYQAALRSEMSARLGVVFDTADCNGQAEITGVPAGLLKLWSKRTAEIEPEAEGKIAEYENSLGRSLTSHERAAVIKTAVLKTRPGKTHDLADPDAGSLRERWVSEAAAAGYNPGQVADAVREAARQAGRHAPGQLAGQTVGAEVAIAAGAVEGAAGQRAVFSRADVAGQVAARLPVAGRSAAGVVALVEELTDRALALEDAVSVGRHPQGRTPRASDARWAGAAVLAAEARILSLADRGRAASYGQVPASTLIVAMTGATTGATTGTGLDLSQYQAISALAGGGDFLSVLTAPAGAGKTRTLGAAAAAWHRAGYRVIGLAPSARAAAELAAATGGGADTLAKWILDHDRRGRLPADARARVVLDAATVVVVDEASMANTHDLDVLVTAAARAAAKVVLVGDPAQIGVIRGPGGMLAALAGAGHGIELEGVHRFAHDWEAQASLGLRAGNPTVLAEYQHHGRVHGAADTAEAIQAVHDHWARERAARREVLMMARTRADVEALNTAARATTHAAAQARGEVRRPAVRLGERDWQAGDLLRARRNDRRLPVGADAHVRNGDRYRVLSADAAGLRVQHLDRGEPAFLPADYVTAHAEYGWATTITSAQGATVDVGIVLARPGLDREHLYVAMTRGRHANHAYITGDAAGDADRHGPSMPGAGRGPAQKDPAVDVLAAALARSGAQDAAHTAREHARTRAVTAVRHAAEQAAHRAAQPVVPAEHTARAAELTQRQTQRADLDRAQQEHRRAAAEARAELARTSRLRPGRRRDLEATITGHDTALHAGFPVAARLGRDIDELARQVARDTWQRQDEQRRAPRPARDARERTEPVLTPARLVAPVTARTASTNGAVLDNARDALNRASDAGTRREAEERQTVERHRRRIHDHTRSREDGPTLGI